ncbi:MAG: hypothetical protein HUJ18_15475 [Marinobacter sp.]|nr:hypothetical protein [Marinobacter sp.]
MKPNSLTLAVKLALTGALAGSLAACGGGSSSTDTASTTSDGTSVGPVTGFGSVYVNGTRFRTDGSVDSDDGIEREDQLEKGMILKVNGSWDDDGDGEARLVSYDDTLRGPVTSASWDDINRTGQIELQGQVVLLDGQTAFGGISPVTLASDPTAYQVRVSGWRLDDGRFQAAYVSVRTLGSSMDDVNEAELEGVVENLDPDAETFTINGFLVDYTNAVADDDFSLDALENGLVVEVEGQLNAAGDTLLAEEIDDEDDLFGDDDDAEVAGDIANYDAAAGQFEINGVTVRLTSDTEFDDLSRDSLQNGLRVKVEGEFRNGVLVAEEVEGRDGDAELDGVIESIDLDAERLVVSGVEVRLSGATLIRDDDSEDDDSRDRVDDLASLSVGEYLEIEGRQRDDEGGYLEAISIERDDEDDDNDFELEGRVTAVSGTSITLMNLEILANGYSLSGISVGDEVEVEYAATSGGQYQLTGSLDD